MLIKKMNNSITAIADFAPNFNTCAIGIYIKMGSKDEKINEQGITHFIEHMLLKSNKYSNRQDQQNRFSELGAELNGFTTKEYMCIYARGLNEQAEKILDELIQMVMYPIFDEKEIKKEKKVILREIAQSKNNYYEIVRSNLLDITFKDHPLTREIIGNEEIVEGFTKQGLMDFYFNRLVGDNLFVSICGRTNKNLLSKLDSLKIKSKMNYIPTPLRALNFNAKKNIDIKAGFNESYLSLGYPGLSVKDENIIPLIVLCNILGNSYNSFLINELRYKKGFLYSINCLLLSYKEGGIVTINTSTSKFHIENLAEIINDVIKQKLKIGIKKEEITRTLSMIKTRFAVGMDDTKIRMLENGKKSVLNITNGLDVHEYYEVMNSVGENDINTVFEQTFSGGFSLSILTS